MAGPTRAGTKAGHPIVPPASPESGVVQFLRRVEAVPKYMEVFEEYVFDKLTEQVEDENASPELVALLERLEAQAEIGERVLHDLRGRISQIRSRIEEEEGDAEEEDEEFSSPSASSKVLAAAKRKVRKAPPKKFRRAE
jgi:hypothetical protein